VAINFIERQNILSDIAELDEQITLLNAAYKASLSNSATESYSLDTGQGKQSLKRRDPSSIFKQLNNLKIRRKRLVQELNGSINVNIRMLRDGR